MNEPSPGLRDRKRRQTRARLERAAVTLVLRDGLEAATVEAISALADVSPRTFFNYFESKDSAILGLHRAGTSGTGVSDQAVEEHLRPAGRDVVESVVALLFEVTGAALPGPAISEDRLEVVRRYPELLAGQLGQLMLIANRLTDAVAAALARDPALVDLPAAELAARAELMLSLCGAGIRVAVREWATAEHDMTEQQLQQRAVALVREVVGQLR